MSNEEILMSYGDIAEDLAEREEWVRSGCISKDPVIILSRIEQDEVCGKLRFIIKTLNDGIEKLTPREKEVLSVGYFAKSRAAEAENILDCSNGYSYKHKRSALDKLDPECTAVAAFVKEWRANKEKEEMQAMALLVPPVVFDVLGPAG